MLKTYDILALLRLPFSCKNTLKTDAPSVRLRQNRGRTPALNSADIDEVLFAREPYGHLPFFRENESARCPNGKMTHSTARDFFSFLLLHRPPKYKLVDSFLKQFLARRAFE